MLTDENDCSLLDDEATQGWLAASHDVAMPRASAACAQNPDDRCCHTCAADAPSGCTPNASDAECSKGTTGYATVAPENDSPHLRCFDQKRRFGLDLLYPTQRYVDALTKSKVRNREGQEVENPIFVAPPGMLPRSPSLVLLTGIVGVPWQDIATDASLTGPGLTYLNAAALEKTGRWDMILGGASGPSDPLMRESIAPRTGMNPVTGTALQPPTGAGDPSPTGGTANPINGHEQNVVALDDLQYACTFPLPVPRPCTDPADDSCDCTAEFRDYARPLCEYTGAPGTPGTQIAAKAYPGLRELSVLRGVGDNGIVASICAKNMQVSAGLLPETDASYGYNPAIAAMLDIVKTRLAQQCLPRQLPVETNPDVATFGQVPCAVVEAMPTRGGSCSCDANRGRTALLADEPELRGAVVDQLRLEEQCDAATKPACGDICLCKIDSLTGPALTACQEGHDDGASYGYCYVDPAQGIGNPELVKSCPAAKRRSLYFVGDGLPANGSTTFMACQGAAAREADGN